MEMKWDEVHPWPAAAGAPPADTTHKARWTLYGAQKHGTRKSAAADCWAGEVAPAGGRSRCCPASRGGVPIWTTSQSIWTTSQSIWTSQSVWTSQTIWTTSQSIWMTSQATQVMRRRQTAHTSQTVDAAAFCEGQIARSSDHLSSYSPLRFYQRNVCVIHHKNMVRNRLIHCTSCLHKSFINK